MTSSQKFPYAHTGESLSRCWRDGFRRCDGDERLWTLGEITVRRPASSLPAGRGMNRYTFSGLRSNKSAKAVGEESVPSPESQPLALRGCATDGQVEEPDLRKMT